MRAEVCSAVWVRFLYLLVACLDTPSCLPLIQIENLNSIKRKHYQHGFLNVTTGFYTTEITCFLGLADNAVISKVNGEVWDLDRPLEDDCTVEILKFDNPDAKQVFWHR